MEIGDFIPTRLIKQQLANDDIGRGEREIHGISPDKTTHSFIFRNRTNTVKMLATTILMLALAATGLAQVPAGYRTVYLTSMVNTKFAIAPKAPVKSGTTIVVLISPPIEHLKTFDLTHFDF